MLLAKKFNFNICIANTICPVIIMKKHIGQDVRGWGWEQRFLEKHIYQVNISFQIEKKEEKKHV